MRAYETFICDLHRRLTMIGCSVFKEQPSPIVQKGRSVRSRRYFASLVRRGSGLVWETPGLRRESRRMCAPVRQHEAAQWTDSTEGRVCVAARSTAQWSAKAIERSRELPVGLEVIGCHVARKLHRHSKRFYIALAAGYVAGFAFSGRLRTSKSAQRDSQSIPGATHNLVHHSLAIR